MNGFEADTIGAVGIRTLPVRILQRLFPSRCGSVHWWDPAICYRCFTPRVEIVTLDHNGDIYEMVCGDRHARPTKIWTNVTLDHPIVGGTWRQVERASIRPAVS